MEGHRPVCLFLLLLASLLITASGSGSLRADCTGCRLTVIETIPIGMEEYDILNHMSTFDGWKLLLEIAESDIEIASFYWTLEDQEYPHESSSQGKEILQLLKDAGTRRNIKIRITKSVDTSSFPNLDPKQLVAVGAAEVRDVNHKQLVGAGVLHTKMWVVDRKHIYIGSANFDWRSLAQVKEIGLLGINCPCLGEDLGKAFDVYWELGNRTGLPGPGWGPEYQPAHNKQFPLALSSEGIKYDTYIASSPPEFCPSNRTSDLDAIFDVIDNSMDFVHIAVMDYSPMVLYQDELEFWPELEYRMKLAAINRKVKVKLLAAKWPQTKSNLVQFLRVLEGINGAYATVDIQVKLFEVESTEDQLKIPFARVNHNKYVVTDKSAYIGTSNWSGDYFIYSGGISIVVTPNANASNDDIRKQMADVFNRDWNSKYSHGLAYYDALPDEPSPGTRAILNLFALSVLALLFM